MSDMIQKLLDQQSWMTLQRQEIARLLERVQQTHPSERCFQVGCNDGVYTSPAIPRDYLINGIIAYQADLIEEQEKLERRIAAIEELLKKEE